jgi:hypothetical protein
MSIINTIEYLSNTQFVPHKNGNQLNYGLGAFGCQSIIKYNNKIWKFIWFIPGTNDAIYINKDGESLVFNKSIKNNCIRMDEA